jgi:hypothetical protein
VSEKAVAFGKQWRIFSHGCFEDVALPPGGVMF